MWYHGFENGEGGAVRVQIFCDLHVRISHRSKFLECFAFFYDYEWQVCLHVHTSCIIQGQDWEFPDTKVGLFQKVLGQSIPQATRQQLLQNVATCTRRVKFEIGNQQPTQFSFHFPNFRKDANSDHIIFQNDDFPLYIVILFSFYFT